MCSWTGSPGRSRSPNDRTGFTLIEILVAVAILALALSVVLQTIGSGLRSVGTSERYLVATMLGRSVLASLGTETPITTGEISGDAGDGYRWTAKLAPSRSISAVRHGDWLRVPYEVQVDVSWNGRAITSLTSLRVAAQPQPGRAGSSPSGP